MSHSILNNPKNKFTFIQNCKVVFPDNLTNEQAATLLVIAEVIYGIDINAVEDESSISENGPLKH
jgi:hypothetical protein